MQSRIRLSIRFIFIFAVIVSCWSLVAQSQAQEAGSAQESPDFPYVAKITGDNVNIRSGPGTNYYRCGQLNTGEKVTVVGTQFSWSQIKPPDGSFSWISQQYIRIDAKDPNTGLLTGDRVRVWAGSEHLEPMYSTSFQVYLDIGDKVKLTGEEKGSYYKIEPPQGAYLWVLSKYTEPAESAEEPEPNKVTEPTTEEITEPKEPAEPNQSEPKEKSQQEKMLQKYHQLREQIKAEQEKELSRQDYSQIKAGLEKLAEDKELDQVSKYAEAYLKLIERYDLAKAVENQLRLQSEHLSAAMEKIQKARDEKLRKIQNLGKYAVVGTLKASMIYGEESPLRQYRVVDDEGKIICYAAPAEQIRQIDMKKFYDHKVGLVGEIMEHPHLAGAMVKFTAIENIVGK